MLGSIVILQGVHQAFLNIIAKKSRAGEKNDGCNDEKIRHSIDYYQNNI